MTSTANVYNYESLHFLCWMIILTCLLQPARAATSDDALLNAIAAVENAPNGQTGAAGERGRWQMMPGTARDRAGYDEQAARRHLAWIRQGLEAAGVAPLPFNIALAWNAGLTRTLQGRALVRHYDYARRVENVYLSQVSSVVKHLTHNQESPVRLRNLHPIMCAPCMTSPLVTVNGVASVDRWEGRVAAVKNLPQPGPELGSLSCSAVATRRRQRSPLVEAAGAGPFGGAYVNAPTVQPARGNPARPAPFVS